MNSRIESILSKLKESYLFSLEESLEIYNTYSLSELMYIADLVRKEKHKDNVVTYIIDRNINITNVCFSFCDFCNFCKKPGDKDSYITDLEEYKIKIEQLFELGGNQVLLQGGMHPQLGIDFYIKLFQDLKTMFPKVYLHALSPSEIVFLSQKEKLSIEQILTKLRGAGLDSLPGGGAEILNDRVRNLLSPQKASKDEWLDVMRIAHNLDISTTATMMFGHIETIAERIEHILSIRDLQNEKPEKAGGFMSFIPWTFQPGNTQLLKKFPENYKTNSNEYLRIIAISRILLNNINNIQASWLTTGTDTAKLALHAGANDLGSIMLEENVVASTGVYGKLSIKQMRNLITESGFIPKQRNQSFSYLN